MFIVVAELKDGTARYLNRAREQVRQGQHFTTLRRWAHKHATYESADEEAGRLNGVAANGHYWQEVAYFRVAPLTNRPNKKAA